MIKLVIFDLDGTLIDTMEDIGNACNYALQSCGCPARPMTDYNKLVGRGIMNLCKDAIPQEMYSWAFMNKAVIPSYRQELVCCLAML